MAILKKYFVVTMLLLLIPPYVLQAQTVQCASFYGLESSYISMGRFNLHAITDSVTLEAWIKPSNALAYASIIGNIWWTSQNVGGYAMWMAGGSNPYYVGFGLADVNNAAELNSALIPGLDQWIHVACTYDGARMVIYVNGDTAASMAHTGQIVYDNYSDLYIGKYHDDTEVYPYSGYIDEVRLWKIARTQSQLRQYDSTELTGNEYGLIGYWKLDEGSGTITQDGTANDMDGTLSSVGWVNETGLPVELASFTAERCGAGVRLQWSTATETNNHGFEVERKTMDYEQLITNNWRKVGFVEGNGTTSAPRTYSFSDNNLQPDRYAYRLKQIDRDGQSAYSKTVEVIVVLPKEFSLDQNYPNPFNPVTLIRYQLPEAGHVSLKIYDALGRAVSVLVDDTREAGVYEAVFDAKTLASGLYVARLQFGTHIQLRKMCLTK